MATLKICTHDRTRWITDVREVIIEESFSVTQWGDEAEILGCCNAPNATRDGDAVRSTIVVDFQKPNPAEKVIGDLCGNVLLLLRSGRRDRVVVPQRACFLMSDSGKTIDRF